MSDLKLSQKEQNELEEQVDRFDKWVESGEGKRALEQAAKKSKEEEARRAEARKIDPKDLEKHVTC